MIVDSVGYLLVMMEKDIVLLKTDGVQKNHNSHFVSDNLAITLTLAPQNPIRDETVLLKPKTR